MNHSKEFEVTYSILALRHTTFGTGKQLKLPTTTKKKLTEDLLSMKNQSNTYRGDDFWSGLQLEPMTVYHNTTSSLNGMFKQLYSPTLSQIPNFSVLQKAVTFKKEYDEPVTVTLPSWYKRAWEAVRRWLPFSR